MIVDLSYEFGYELAVAVPHAYDAYLRGELVSTTSCFDTKVFYPFSHNHKEIYSSRVGENYGDDFPNHFIERASFEEDLWTPPPLKKIYRNNIFVFEKPMLVIANKYCIEYGSQPRNFLNEEVLDTLFSRLKHKYQVIYCRYKGEGANDGSWDLTTVKVLEDDAILTKHPEVLSIEQLHKQHPYLTYNTLQVMIYANCERFISVSGGTTIFISYFAPQTVMYGHICRDIYNGSTKGWYKQLSGTEVFDVPTYDTLIRKVDEIYL